MSGAIVIHYKSCRIEGQSKHEIILKYVINVLSLA